ncbi:HAD domain-containing protein [Stutzerimonas stutzeri]|jgi:hypothetical protein|nr:HAD domain-containing protein [Stutzerimonas stutzeri]
MIAVLFVRDERVRAGYDPHRPQTGGHIRQSEWPMLLFLDFDGVLHPDAVFRRSDGRIELRADGELFMWAPILVEALSGLASVRIVLSTSWVRHLGFQRARKALPAELQMLVIGATWHSAMRRTDQGTIAWDEQTRYQQIATYLTQLSSAPTDWLAIDDDNRGWPDVKREHLLLTDSAHGLSSLNVTDLCAKLTT